MRSQPHSSEEFGKVGCTQPGNGVPSCLSWESVGSTSWVTTCMPEAVSHYIYYQNDNRHLPVVMSLSAAAPAAEYRNGLRNPSAGCPTDKSWSLSNAITLAKIGLEQLVPETTSISLSTTISTFSACADTSGNARPDVLNFPAFVVPSVVRYLVTAAVWYEGRAKKLEKPPDEKVAAISVSPVVPPTDVRNGQPEGNVGRNDVHVLVCDPQRLHLRTQTKLRCVSYQASCKHCTNFYFSKRISYQLRFSNKRFTRRAPEEIVFSF